MWSTCVCGGVWKVYGLTKLGLQEAFSTEFPVGYSKNYQMYLLPVHNLCCINQVSPRGLSPLGLQERQYNDYCIWPFASPTPAGMTSSDLAHTWASIILSIPPYSSSLSRLSTSRAS